MELYLLNTVNINGTESTDLKTCFQFGPKKCYENPCFFTERKQHQSVKQNNDNNNCCSPQIHKNGGSAKNYDFLQHVKHDEMKPKYCVNLKKNIYDSSVWEAFHALGVTYWHYELSNVCKCVHTHTSSAHKRVEVLSGTDLRIITILLKRPQS